MILDTNTVLGAATVVVSVVYVWVVIRLARVEWQKRKGKK